MTGRTLLYVITQFQLQQHKVAIPHRQGVPAEEKESCYCYAVAAEDSEVQ
eukprot:NODE_9567_length_226_cov_1.435028_g8952_i0.p2 GENE.NODE_9567_length_226_cov_1.435028_g8952_i0~~NODE_9567_length_226_cov_1.435028_g8952_i0.p2  ORF type:complete len:50 (-),score=8.17 NODE_9567_length_226_cov_1.435028_g8952_i0:37-186(-)